MDDVVDLIRATTVPLYGICFGHQIIAHAFGGRIERADEDSHFVAEVFEQSGNTVMASFAHQEHVVDSGELVVIASSEHCKNRSIQRFQSIQCNTTLRQLPKFLMQSWLAET